MQVSIAEMAEGRNVQVVLLRNAFNGADHSGKFAPWNRDILQDRRRTQSGQRTERAATSRSQLHGFRRAGRALHGGGTMVLAYLLDLRRLVRDGTCMPVRLDKENRGGVPGKTDFREVFNTVNRFPVKKLESTGYNLRGDDCRNRLRRCVHRRIGSQQSLTCRRFWQQLEQDMGHHAQPPRPACLHCR